MAEGADGVAEGGGEEGYPGKEPEEEQGPEDGDGDLAVVVGDAAAEEAGDVLVVEIEPGPAGVGGKAEAGGHGGWVDCGRAARMCHGAAMARKKSVDGMRWSFARSLRRCVNAR